MISAAAQMVLDNGAGSMRIENSPIQTSFIQENTFDQGPEFSSKPEAQSFIRLVAIHAEFRKHSRPESCERFANRPRTDYRPGIHVDDLEKVRSVSA
jgi:hypothetical protein